MNAASVCRAIETSRRREVLPFNFHAEVVGLPTPELQDDGADTFGEFDELVTEDYRLDGYRVAGYRLVPGLVGRRKLPLHLGKLGFKLLVSQIPDNLHLASGLGLC